MTRRTMLLDEDGACAGWACDARGCADCGLSYGHLMNCPATLGDDDNTTAGDRRTDTRDEE